jgi:hypothetical protein
MKVKSRVIDCENRFACMCMLFLLDVCDDLSGVRMMMQPHPRRRVWESCGCILTFVRGCMGISFHVHLPLIAVTALDITVI